MTERLVEFIKLVRITRWRKPPAVWNEQLRTALNDGLVKVGWGGILELTDAGSAMFALSHVGRVAGESSPQKSEGK